MRKFSLLLILSALILGLFSGCGSAPTLPALDLYGSTITGTVEYMDGQSCRILVTEGDSHYDTETQVQITYTSIVGKDALAVGDKITVEYDYVKHVTDYNGLPHITVEQIHIA